MKTIFGFREVPAAEEGLRVVIHVSKMRYMGQAPTLSLGRNHADKNKFNH